MNANDARKRFSQSPIGTWASYLGGGNDMHIGMKLTFNEDGTGIMEERGFDHQYLDPTYASQPAFQWRTKGDRKIEITHRGESREVAYDFKTTRNEYGIKELRMFEPGLKPDEYGEVGFWVSPFSLVYQDQQNHGIIRQLWEKLT